MDDHEPRPDHTEDPREQGTGQGGYPETNPEQAIPDEAEDRPRSEGGGDSDSDAPSPSTDREADRERTTGNPGAAG
jgi:hypothetical protein